MGPSNLMPLELILFILQEQFMQDLAKVWI